MPIADLIWTAFIMLKGKEGIDFSYYNETDPNWWYWRLWISRN